MCPVPCSERYHTLREYCFDDPERNEAKRLKDVNGRPRAGPGRPRQRRSRQIIFLETLMHAQQNYFSEVKMTARLN